MCSVEHKPEKKHYVVRTLMSEFLIIQQGTCLNSNVAQLKRYKTLERFLIQKILKDLNYFFSHTFLFNAKSDLSNLTFRLQPKILETYILNG